MDKKVVLVTGSSIGLGRTIIEKFASNNYNVIINYNKNKQEAEELKKFIENTYHTKAITIKCDITNESQIENMKQIIIKEFGMLDCLVNNAAIAIDTDFNLKTKDDFIKILDTNLVSLFLVSRTFGNLMLENKKGKIINISSSNAIDSYYEYSLDYDSSKAGVINLTHNLANHYSPYINVNCICPGWIDTPMNKDLDESFKQKEIDKILLGRFASPKEIASLVYFLSTEEASYINDSIIKIDGGKKC
jgi:3-oxoacyl-[acyl-carrier protein] reductase